jgi:molybdopterin synthase sulfur carrier subunit
MTIPVRIPTPLRKLTQNQEVVEAEGSTIRELINSLENHYPGLKERICDEQDHIRRFVNIFLNDEDVRFLKESETPVKSGDEVSIVPAIAGG